MAGPKTLSPKRREWLEMLADSDVPLKCPFVGSVGFGCRHFGWVEWAYVGPDGKLLPRSAAIALVGSQAWVDLTASGYDYDARGREYITDAGREMIGRSAMQ